MAMIDEHVDRSLAEVTRLREAAASLTEHLELLESPQRRRPGPIGADPVLLMEFMLYALRNPENRPRLAEHQRRWREFIAAVVRHDAERLGVEPPMSPEDAGAMLLAIDNGYLIGELIEPGSYEPGTYSRNLLVLQQLWEASIPASATGGHLIGHSAGAEADDTEADDTEAVVTKV